MKANVRLAELVEAFFAARPWEQLEDQVFGLRVGSEHCFAGLMGSAGREFGVLLVKGWAGYRLLRGMLDGDLDDATTIQDANLLALSIDQPHTIPHKFTTYAKRHGLQKVPGFGQPIIMVKRPRRSAVLPTAHDKVMLCKWLSALVELAQLDALQPARRRRQRSVLIFERNESGTLHPTWVPIPEAPPQPIEELLSEEARLTCEPLPRLPGRYLVAFHAGDLSIRGEVPRLLIVVDESQDKILHSAVFNEAPGMPREVFDALLRVFHGRNAMKQPGLPTELVTNSKLFYDLFKRDLARLRIRVACAARVPHLDFVLEEFFTFLEATRRRRP